MENINVFVLDDDQTALQIISAFFNRFAEAMGHSINIRTETDPVNGLRELSSSGGEYQAILMDVRLPKLTGDEIYDSLLRVNPNILDRILFVTGCPEVLLNRFSKRAVNILEKPFRYDMFEKRIHSILAIWL